MHELDILRDLVVIFAAALLVVALLGRLRIPSIAGYIVAGTLVGPNALGLVADTRKVELLAEVGVVLLLFGIGLELSIDRIRKLWRAVLIGGTIQVALTTTVTFAVARAVGLPTGQSVFLGLALAVSSTAIVLRGLSARGELDAPHGRLAVGILIFQDLAVVPMMLALPYLAGAAAPEGGAWRALVAAVGVVGGSLLAMRVVAPVLLNVASRTRQRDLFMLAVAVICLGMAWVVSYAGVSVALGAFLAGLVVSGSEFRHQALSEVIPLREVLASVFFVSVGMLLDAREVAGHAGPILGLLLAILLGKFLIVFLAAALMRLPVRVCLLTAMVLCQVGEFSFVLLESARQVDLVSPPLVGNLLVAVILSMLVTPFLMSLGPRFAAGVGRITPLTRLLQVRSLEDEQPRDELRDHVVIAGFGVTGQELAISLEQCGVAYVVVDLNVENVRLATGRGIRAYFGDATSPEVLERLGLARAKEMVVAINDPDATRRTVVAARRFSKDVRITARTAYLEDAIETRRAGADEAVSAEIEAAVEVTYLILKRRGADTDTLASHLTRIRARRATDQPAAGTPPAADTPPKPGGRDTMLARETH